MIAMYNSLKLLKKDVTMFSHDFIPTKLEFLKETEFVTADTSTLTKYDVMIMLDCGSRDRAGDFITNFSGYKILINIDHHVSNKYFGDVNFIELASSCTGEHVYFITKRILADLGITKIPNNISIGLLCALYDDTGGMRYVSTTARTLRIAADIVESGADCSFVSENLFFSVSRERMELTRRVLQTLTYECNAKIAYMTMTIEDLERTNSAHEDSNGLIDFPRSIEGVEVAFIIKEMGKGKYKFSFRSRGKVDLNSFCSLFGGGGHKVASGCTVYGELAEVKEKVLSALRPLV